MPQAHEHLLEKAYQDKLKAALREAFRRDSCAFRSALGEASGDSPADDRRARAASGSRRSAVAAIEQDPFVRDLVENFGARVNDELDQT